MSEHLPRLYSIAHAALCRAAFVVGQTVEDGQPITSADARRALAAAVEAMGEEIAGQPDPIDALAFLQRLQADELVTRVGSEWVLDLDRAPL